MSAHRAPDLILLNGRVHTQDDALPRAEALAVNGNRISAVGATRDVEALAGPGTERIDLQGGTVLPGMMDGHIHFHEWAQRRAQLDLSTVKSLQEAMAAVRSAAERLDKGRWIIGFGFNDVDWPENRKPGREDLDRAAPQNPVILWRSDLHLAAVNSRALELARIHKDTPDPPEGTIDRDAGGRPTGILREMAINVVRDRMPRPSPGELDEILARGISALHALGITGFHDIRLMDDQEGPAALRSLERLRERDRLTMRSWVSFAGHMLGPLRDLGIRTGLGDDYLRIGYLKYFSDGGMGARTAWMLEPYLDAECGMPLADPGELGAAVLEADAAGLAVMIHAVGDRANREVIGIFEKVSAARRSLPAEALPAVPHRIEHVQMIHPDDLKRLSALPVAACLTPHNMILDIGLIDASVGPRGSRGYAFRPIIDTGIPVFFSSDSPVCDPNPLLGIQAAVTRQRQDGSPEGGWYPEHRIGVDEAVRAYTRTPAEVHGRGHELGRIAPGYLADLAVLEEDPHLVPPGKISAIRVSMTLFDGRVVFSR